jgi:nucleotide-binding universal stress UspA family protein
MTIQTIVVATDFSEVSNHAIEYAVDLAKQVHGRVVILHAYEIPVYGFPDGVLIAPPDVATRLGDVARNALDATVAKYSSSGVPVKGVLRVGPPVDEVERVADEEHGDLIVVGTHGRRGLSRALLGSVAENVIRTSKIPVLAIHAAKAA